MPKSTSSQEIDGQILKCLEDATGDLSIEEIAKVIHAHRNTVSKYIYALERSKDIVRTRDVGRAKFYTTAERSA